MLILIIGLIILAGIAMTVGVLHNRQIQKKIESGEELDRFRGRPSNGYNEEEVEEFREIMYTCKEDEVAGWSRSLQLRGIELPDELKDELFLIVGERRFK